MLLHVLGLVRVTFGVVHDQTSIVVALARRPFCTRSQYHEDGGPVLTGILRIELQLFSRLKRVAKTQKMRLGKLYKTAKTDFVRT